MDLAAGVRTAIGRRQARGVVYRTRSQAVTLGLILVVDLGLPLPRVLAAKDAVAVVAGATLLVAIGILLARAALAVLVTTDHGVFVRNPFRSVSVAWDDIAGFEIGRYKLLGCVCLVRRTDGLVLPAFAIQGITGQPRRKTTVAAQRAVDELNTRLGQARRAAP
jgi:uncharacterized membrane protein YphA (DoxX/SURF4 family)